MERRIGHVSKIGQLLRQEECVAPTSGYSTESFAASNEDWNQAAGLCAIAQLAIRVRALHSFRATLGSTAATLHVCGGNNTFKRNPQRAKCTHPAGYASILQQAT